MVAHLSPESHDIFVGHDAPANDYVRDTAILADTIAHRCEKAHQTKNDGWKVCCPAHDDRNPSLSIDHTPDRVLLKCHAGCSTEAIVSALGMTMADLYAAPSTRSTHTHVPQHRREEAYDYCDAHGALLYQKVRVEVPGKKKTFYFRRPDPANPDAYINGVGDSPRVPYNLPAVLAAKERGEPIYTAEGEKDCKTLMSMGYVATCNDDGAGKWPQSCVDALTSAHVIMLPDNDTAGENHARIVQQALAGKAASFLLARVPTPHKDVTDWVNAGVTKEDIAALIAAEKSAQEESEGLNSHFIRKDCELSSPHEIRGKRLNSLNSLNSHVDTWPVLQEEALYGLAGDFVRAIEPHSEADTAALLTQFLATFGIVIGRNRYFQVEATRHYTNIFLVIAGLTSRARKGTSAGHTEAPIRTVDATWSLANHIKGAGSGEGLIYAVRDKRMGKEAMREKGKITGYQEIEVDPGVEDKRGLYQTGEFSSILKVAAREGNTLSEVIRDIWDTGYLRNATKGSPLTATDAHIGIIGHITIDEVQKLLTSTDMANGFANRFIWICARRSKELPEGGDLDTVNFAPLLKRLRTAVTFGKGTGRMQRDAQAKAAWAAVYGMLSEGSTGLADTILARAEAQVLRLSMLYALLDESSTIRHEHLNAALAVWQYAEESATYIFGQVTGDESSDVLLDALALAGEDGLTARAISDDVYKRHKSSEEIARAIAALTRQGRIVAEVRTGKGRPSKIYRLADCELSELSELSHRRYLIASNDAVKSMRLNSQDSLRICELSPQSSPDVPSTPSPCHHEQVTDGVCITCGEVQDAPPVVTPSADPDWQDLLRQATAYTDQPGEDY
jgi:5S rRNA maturation endonuclease (ribonuclease M5)